MFPVDPNNSGDYPVDCFRSYDARPDINISDPSWLHEGNSLDLFPDLKQTDSMGCPLVEPPMPPESHNLETSSSDPDQVLRQ